MANLRCFKSGDVSGCFYLREQDEQIKLLEACFCIRNSAYTSFIIHVQTSVRRFISLKPFLNNWMLRFSMLRKTKRKNSLSCMKWEVPFDWPIRDALNRVTSVAVSIYVNEKSEANAHIGEAIHHGSSPSTKVCRSCSPSPTDRPWVSEDGPEVSCGGYTWAIDKSASSLMFFIFPSKSYHSPYFISWKIFLKKKKNWNIYCLEELWRQEEKKNTLCNISVVLINNNSFGIHTK